MKRIIKDEYGCTENNKPLMIFGTIGIVIFSILIIGMTIQLISIGV